MFLLNFIGPEIFLLFAILLSFASLGLTIWAVIEIATKPFKREKDKVIWIVIVLILGLIGPLIYLAKRKDLLADPLPDSREYLPDLDDRRARPLVQRRDDEQSDYV